MVCSVYCNSDAVVLLFVLLAVFVKDWWFAAFVVFIADDCMIKLVFVGIILLTLIGAVAAWWEWRPDAALVALLHRSCKEAPRNELYQL